MNPLIVVLVLFALALLGAFTLFKFLESSAFVRNKTYQAGGAIGGFVILYGILYSSFYSMESNEYHKIKSEYERLKQKFELAQISGSIVPYQKDTAIILAVEKTDPDANGNFKFRAPCIDPEVSEPRIYVMRDGRHISLMLSEEEMNGIQIPMDYFEKEGINETD